MAVCFLVLAIGGLILWVLVSELSSGGGKDDKIQDVPGMEVRVRKITVDDLPAKQIEVKGPFPLQAYNETVGFVVSVFDNTDDKLHPVLSVVEAFQEPYTLAYDSRAKVGEVLPGTGLHPYTPIGLFIPNIMLGPHGGHREFLVVVRLVDVHTKVIIVNGRVLEGKDGVYWTGTCGFTCSLGKRGYIEFHQRRRELRSVIIRLAAAVAVADGYLEAGEIQVIRQKIEKWVEKAESAYDGLGETQREESYKAIVAHALNDAMADQIDTDALLNRLRHEEDQKLWYEILELCFDVMAADGIADVDELGLLREIGDASEIDARDIEKLRDRKIIDLKNTNTVKTPIEELLGIAPDWDPAIIKCHLRKEYRKWNSRLNTVSEGKARQNAQNMLNIIGEAYKDYTSSENS
ncbi:MAG: TerB family tellurite resistance protein [Rhodothermaceae bacterium]|nr:TerB family tellurite resistance protein [Rhodothermaceae bacterium]MYE64079.1 TerB family tellurite resistance protein [Rhodothermaceae bacterium]MYJ19255.1 TerB family tellurite resistance protein [Rhodothermaceae bacterium]